MANRFEQFLSPSSPAPAPPAAQPPANRFQQFVEQPPRPTEVGRRWGDVASQAAGNFIPSLKKFGGDLYDAATNPIDTANAMLDLTAGGISRGIEGATGLDIFPENRATQVADAAGKFYSDRYGSVEGFKRALAEDPVGVMSDASILFTGGGSAAVKGAAAASKASSLASTAGKVANVAGKIGKGVRFAGEVMDPVSLAGKLGKGAVKGTAAISSGLGMAPINAAYDATKVGGSKRKVFWDNINERVPMTDVLDEANLAAGNIEAAGQAAYRRDIASTISNKTPVEWKNVFGKVNDVIRTLTTSGGTFKGGKPAEAMLGRIEELFNKYHGNAAEHTAEGLDALKQELQGLEVKSASELTAGQGQANRLATAAANAVWDEIVRIDPKYAETMAGYHNMAETLRELTQTFGTGGKASVDSALRRLQSVMRNNANTNYGYRGQLLDQLDAAGHGTLRPALAGQAMNSKMPRGLAVAGGATTLPMAAAWAASNPWMLAGIAPFAAAASPRAVGTVTGLLGDAAGRIDRAPTAVKAVKKALVDAPTSRPVRTTAAKAQNWVMEDAQGNRYDIHGNIVQ